MKHIAITILFILFCGFHSFMEVFEIDIGNARRGGPVQVINLDDLMNNLNRRRGVMREITIEVSPEGITETTKTIDNDGNETIEITQKGNLNKSGKRTNAGEIIFGLDNSIENLIFGLLNGGGIEVEFGRVNPMMIENTKSTEEENKEHAIEKHRFDNLTDAELEFDEEKRTSPIVIETIEEEEVKDKNKTQKKKKGKNKKDKDSSNHKSLGEDLITQINHAHVKVEELKKEKPKINILAKVIKFVFYFMALVIMIFILRLTLKHFSLTKGSSMNIESSSNTTNKVENIVTDNINDNKDKIDKAD